MWLFEKYQIWWNSVICSSIGKKHTHTLSVLEPHYIVLRKKNIFVAIKLKRESKTSLLEGNIYRTSKGVIKNQPPQEEAKTQ